MRRPREARSPARLSGDQHRSSASGSDIAGRPVRFATAVKGVNSVFRSSCAIAPVDGVLPTDGHRRERQRGREHDIDSLQKATIRRASVWSRATAGRSRRRSSLAPYSARPRLSAVMSDSSTGCSVGPICQTSMNVPGEVRVAPGRAALLDPVTHLQRRAAASATAPTHARSTGTSIGGVEDTAIRRRPGGSSADSANGWAGDGAHQGSPGSYPVMTSSRWAASSTVRVSGPAVDRPSSVPNGARETRPRDGFSPNSPQQEAGMRIEPPPSPRARPERDRPRALRRHLRRPTRRQLGVPRIPRRPVELGLVNATVPNSGVFVLPTITKPASRSRRTTARSKSGTYSAYAREE